MPTITQGGPNSAINSCDSLARTPMLPFAPFSPDVVQARPPAGDPGARNFSIGDDSLRTLMSVQFRTLGLVHALHSRIQGFRAKLSVYPSSAVVTPHLFQKVAVQGVYVA